MIRKMTCFLFLFAAMVGLTCFADSPPTAEAWLNFNLGGLNYTVSPTSSAFDITGGGSSYGFRAIAGAGTSPSLSLQVWMTSNYSPNSLTIMTEPEDFDLDYWVNIAVPGGGNVSVPGRYTYSGGINGNADVLSLVYGSVAQFDAHLNVDSTNDGVWWEPGEGCCNDGSNPEPCPDVPWSGTETSFVSIPANTWYEFELLVYGDASVDNIGSAGFTAYIDPTLTINQSFLNQHPGTQIEYSVLSAPANVTPEPLPLLLLGTGLVAMGLAKWRKRKTALEL